MKTKAQVFEEQSQLAIGKNLSTMEVILKAMDKYAEIKNEPLISALKEIDSIVDFKEFDANSKEFRIWKICNDAMKTI